MFRNSQEFSLLALGASCSFAELNSEKEEKMEKVIPPDLLNLQHFLQDFLGCCFRTDTNNTVEKHTDSVMS